MPRRKRTRRKQRGGVRFSDIITVENRDRFIGQEIEIERLDDYLIQNLTDIRGEIDIIDLEREPGFIQETRQFDINFYGEELASFGERPGILSVYYPKYDEEFLLRIPQTLQDLGNELGPDRPDYPVFNYYVRLKRQRGPDLFTRNEMMATMGENRRMNTFNPRIGTFHGYVPPTSIRDRMSDAVGNAPNPNRYLPRDVFDLISAPLRESVLNDRYLRRSRYPGSRYR